MCAAAAAAAASLVMNSSQVSRQIGAGLTTPTHTHTHTPSGKQQESTGSTDWEENGFGVSGPAFMEKVTAFHKSKKQKMA